MSNRLLPVGSSPLEVAAAAACAELAAMPVPLRDLWDPATCPVNLLPYLAWAFSVDHWDETWTEDAKRSVVAAAFFIHRHKGTIGAIRRVVEPLGYLIKLREWWETNGEPGTFTLDIGVLENGITEEMYLEMERMIADAKPVSRHLTGLALNLEAAGAIDVAGGQYDGELTTVYPDYASLALQMLEGHYQFLQRNTGTTLDSTQQHFVFNDEHVLADSRHERELSRMAGLPNDATTEGQALQILGYAHAYLATGEQKYLDQAIACFDAYVTYFYDGAPIPDSPQRWIANWIVNAKEPVPANWPVDTRDPTHSGFKGIPLTFNKGRTQIPHGAPYWGEYLDIATFAFDGALAWDAVNAQVRALNAAGEIDWNNDGTRYDVDWIINWQGYQIGADGEILAKGLPAEQIGTVQLKDATLGGNHKLNFANRQPVEHGGVLIERNQVQHNRPLHVPVPHNAMGNAADAELWFADACYLLHSITGEQRYFNAWKSVEFTAMEYTDIDAQDKFFRQSRSANTPFTDGISYDWSYPSGAPVSYGRSAEGMITIRKEIASQQSLEQQAIWFRINRQSKIRTCFGGVDDQNQPISCKIQLSIAPEKNAASTTEWGIGLPQSLQPQVKTYDIALSSLAALTKEDGSDYLLADLRAVTDYGGCAIASQFEEQVYDSRSATVIQARFPNDDAGMVIGAWLTAEESFPVTQLVYRADADFNLRLEDDDKWRWYWMLPATGGKWQIANFAPQAATLSGYQPDHQDVEPKPAAPRFSRVKQVTILQDGNVPDATFSYYVLNDIPPTLNADDGYTIRYRITFQAAHPYTALLGDCTLLNHRRDGLFCTPGVMPFSNIYQADSQQFDGWHGMPYPGYQYPFIFVHAAADPDGVMLNNMVEFLWQSQQWYQQQFGVLGPSASAYIWNRWDNLSYGPADTWTMYHWGDGTAWSGYQPRAFFGAARAWLELQQASKTPPLKLVEYVENWLRWLIDFTNDAGGVTPTDFPMAGLPQPDAQDFTGHMCGLWLAGAVLARMAGSEIEGLEHFIEQCVTELQRHYLSTGDVMDGGWSPAPRLGTDNGMFFGFWSGEILRGLSLYVMYKNGLTYPAGKQKRNHTMTAKYRALLTEQGKALLANAAATGQKLEITHMAVGDGGGSPTQPDESQTKLVNEKRRAELNSLQIDTGNSNQVIAEQVIPEDVGGWWIRELGLYDKNGVLVALANTPDTYKPQLTEGASRTQVVRMVLLVKGDANATIVADKTALLVSRDTLSTAIAEHARSRNHPDATLLAKGFTQLSNDSNSGSETLAATPKAVKAVNDASLKIAANLKDLPNKSVARGNLELGTAATRNVGAQKTNLMEVGAFGLGGGPIHREDALSNRGEIYRVNGTSKNAPGGGVYGVLNLPCDGGPSSGYLAIQTNGWCYIGTSTTPDKPLNWYRIYTTGFKPTAADVGAYSKTESDGKFVKQSGDTISGSLTVNGAIETKSGLTTPYATVTGSLTTKGGVELFGNAPYLDFHYGNSNSDFDVRLINDNKGILAFHGNEYYVNGKLSATGDAWIGGRASINGTTAFNGGDYLLKQGNYTNQDGSRQTNGIRLQGQGDLLTDLYHYEKTGSFHEFGIHVANGGGDGWFSFRNNGEFRANSTLFAAGAAYQTDGNINGSIWGGYLSNWITARIRESGQVSVNGDQWWYKDQRTGLYFQGGHVVGNVNDGGEAYRIPLHIAVPNRLLNVSITLKNFAQGFDTTWNPQISDLNGARDSFTWFHGSKERDVYWMAVGY